MDGRFFQLGFTSGTNENSTSAETTLGPQSLSSRGTKRKWSYPPSSSDNQSSATACATTASAKEIGEEFSLKLDFTMHLDKESNDVDLELSLCSGISESGITIANINSDLPKGHTSKQIQVPGCSEGASCRCQKENSRKGAEARTAYCKAHGGGRWCEFFGSLKSAEGRMGVCREKRCKGENCAKGNVKGRTGICVDGNSHGGGISLTEYNWGDSEDRVHGGSNLGEINLIEGKVMEGNMGNFLERDHVESCLRVNIVREGNLGNFEESSDGGRILGVINLMGGNLGNLEERIHGGSLMNLFRDGFGGCYKNGK